MTDTLVVDDIRQMIRQAAVNLVRAAIELQNLLDPADEVQMKRQAYVTSQINIFCNEFGLDAETDIWPKPDRWDEYILDQYVTDHVEKTGSVPDYTNESWLADYSTWLEIGNGASLEICGDRVGI